MKIVTKEQYDKIPNGTILKLFLEGDEWDEDCGTVSKVIKQDNRLYEIYNGYYEFDEKDEKDYEFSLVYSKQDNLNNEV